MRKRGGSIINISSIFALIGSDWSVASYNASKGGILSLTRALAIEWLPII
ncbi:MAG: SDR family oxidoreductase [Thermoproteales archaeon]|nr:SDR family oxidoreductase [Thermoproteales archaeon]